MTRDDRIALFWRLTREGGDDATPAVIRDILEFHGPLDRDEEILLALVPAYRVPDTIDAHLRLTALRAEHVKLPPLTDSQRALLQRMDERRADPGYVERTPEQIRADIAALRARWAQEPDAEGTAPNE